jgi:hypothetical protein
MASFFTLRFFALSQPRARLDGALTSKGARDRSNERSLRPASFHFNNICELLHQETGI